LFTVLQGEQQGGENARAGRADRVPRAMAPPFTFTRSQSQARARPFGDGLNGERLVRFDQIVNRRWWCWLSSMRLWHRDDGREEQILGLTAALA